MDVVFAEIQDERNLANYNLLSLNKASKLKWKPIDLLVDFRNDYLQHDFRSLATADYAQTTDFRKNHIEDFRKNYTSIDFRAGFKQTDFKIKSANQIQNSLPTKATFPQRAPAASSDYLGISNSKYSTNHNYATNFNFTSNFTVSSSNYTFKSSDDINAYLLMHPDYSKLPKSMVDAIIAIITSGLVLLGGIALCVLTWGTTAPPLILGELIFV